MRTSAHGLVVLLASAVACGPSEETSGLDEGATELDTGTPEVACLAGVEVGRCPEDVSLVDMDGELRTFSEFQGGPLLVMGTAAWCPSCDGLLFSLHEWSTTEAPEELSILLVITDSANGGPGGEVDAAGYSMHAPTWTVVGDHRRQWVDAWRGDNGSDHYIYGLLDEDGQMLWHRADGDQSSVDELAGVVADALF